MQNVDIYFSNDSELSEYEAVNKGYRIDIYTKIGDNIFNLRMYTLIRLKQDFETEIETSGFYLHEPNLILVKETNKLEIIDTINNLYKQKYFDKIKPINDTIDISKLVKVQ